MYAQILEIPKLLPSLSIHGFFKWSLSHSAPFATFKSLTFRRPFSLHGSSSQRPDAIALLQKMILRVGISDKKPITAEIQDAMKLLDSMQVLPKC